MPTYWGTSLIPRLLSLDLDLQGEEAPVGRQLLLVILRSIVSKMRSLQYLIPIVSAVSLFLLAIIGRVTFKPPVLHCPHGRRAYGGLVYVPITVWPRVLALV